jgi:hypothetical protein
MLLLLATGNLKARSFDGLQRRNSYTEFYEEL